MVDSFLGRVSRHRPIEESIVVLNMDDDASAMGYSGHSRAIAVNNVKRIPFVTVDQDCRWNDATSRLQALSAPSVPSTQRDCLENADG